MKFPVYVLATVLAAASVAYGAGNTKFYYDAQVDWPMVPAPGGSNNECAREHASGIGQSPINIQRSETCSVVDEGYKFYVGDCTVDDYSFSINDHGVKAEIVGTECTRPAMMIPGIDKVYEVLQLHIHTGCEHNMDYKGCDAELHIVHVAKSDITAAAATGGETSLPDLAVVGIMMNGGDNHEEAIEPLLDSWSAVSCTDDCDTNADNHKEKSMNPYSFLPSGTDFYKYVGGLTTPPCWEVVNWNVAAAAMDVSWRQILAISNLVNQYSGYRNERNVCVDDSTVSSAAGLTGRELQPLLGRQVQKVCEPYTMAKDIPDIEISRKADEESIESDIPNASMASAGDSRKLGVASIVVVAALVLSLA